MLADPAVQVIFEATFQWRHGTAKVDILERGRTGWIIREVKSNLHGSQTAELIDDVAYTALVAGGSGLTVGRVPLAVGVARLPHRHESGCLLRGDRRNR